MANEKYPGVIVPGCIPAPLRRALSEMNYYVGNIAGDVTNLEANNTTEGDGPVNLNGQPASYYLDLSNHTGFLPNASSPTRTIKLTTAVSGGSASAEFYEWNGSSYAAVTGTFTVYDPFGMWGHSLANDIGFVSRDAVRGEWLMAYMKSSIIRNLTLDEDLVRGGTSDTNSGAGPVVNGYLVRTDRQIPFGARVSAYYNVSDATWYVLATDTCDEAVPP